MLQALTLRSNLFSPLNDKFLLTFFAFSRVQLNLLKIKSLIFLQYQ